MAFYFKLNAMTTNSRIDAVLIAFNPLLAEKRQNLYTSK